NPLKAFEEALPEQAPSPQRSQQSGGESADDEAKRLAEMLKNVVEKKQSSLENLPQDAGGRVKELQEYEFMDPEAAAKFQELMQMLKQPRMDGFFKDLSQQIANMSPEDMARMKEMMHDLNKMLSEKM